MTRFELVPFSTADAPPIAIGGEVGRNANGLKARFRLQGTLREIVVPSRVAAPARRDELWRSTCLELFVGARGSDGYLEVNVAPSGDWNVYRFAGYRSGMAPLDPAPVDVRLDARSDEAVEVVIELALPAEMAGVIDVALTAVIERAAGGVAYYALAHKGDRPDFHRRDSFLIGL